MLGSGGSSTAHNGGLVGRAPASVLWRTGRRPRRGFCHARERGGRFLVFLATLAEASWLWDGWSCTGHWGLVMRYRRSAALLVSLAALSVIVPAAQADPPAGAGAGKVAPF
jgi:hypothetical protein